MEIFRALRDESTQETYLQSLLRKGAKREVPYIVHIHLSEEIQTMLAIQFSDEGLSLDRPWKTVPKKLIVKHVQKFKDKSPFHPFIDNVKLLRDQEILIGLDTSNLKNLTNYYICVTQEGKTAVLEELKSLHKRIMEYIDQSFSKEPGKWMSLGTEKELDSFKAVENRPLISYEWVGNKIDRMDRTKPLNFTDLDAENSSHAHCSVTERVNIKYKLIEAVAIHTETQVAPNLADTSAQTVPEIPLNASTQFNPEIDAQEKEERIQNQAPVDEGELAEQLKSQYDKIIGALKYNEEYDLYKDDYECLVKEGRKSDVTPAPQYTHFLTLVNTMCDPSKYITCTAWHPGLCGTVAVGYGENVLFKDEDILSNSDDSDYETKPSKPEENIPKMNQILQAAEVVEAAIWKDFSHEMLEHFDKKQDTTDFKLGLITLAYLNTAQKIRDREIFLEKKYEESRPELDELEFTLEQEYELYDEDSYDPEADLMFKFRLDEYANVPPETNAPEEAAIIKFEDQVRPYLLNDNKPVMQETKTFNIVWDSNHWSVGYGLKEEAVTVHRTEYRAHKSKKKKAGRKASKAGGSRASKSSLLIPSSVGRGSNVSRVSDSASMGSYGSLRSVGGKSQLGKKGEPTPKKKSEYPYVEITDDEEMERHEREHEIVETGPIHNVYIWSIHNDLEPMLKCVSPYEVSALNFCPHNGDLLAAGTVSGQIVLWDMQGRLLKQDDHEPSPFERYARKELKKRMSWCRQLKFPDRLRETAVSTMSGAHNSKVISIQWVHPQLIFEQGHFLNIQAEGDMAAQYSLQFLSTSVDGDIKCWDLDKEPLPRSEYMFAERTIARKIKNPKPEMLTSLISKYADYNKRWYPTYTLKEPITESAKGVKSQASLLASSVQFHSKLYPYKRKYEPNPRFKDKMTDLVEYVYTPLPTEQVTYSQTAFIGTMYGAVALLCWQGQPPNPKANEPTDSEMLNITFMESVHDGPIIGVLRHPFVSDVALSVGGHVFAIWNFQEMTWPIKWKRYYGKQITCCSWSPLKPSLFRIGLTDGTVEIWDLILQSHEPKFVIPAAGVGITGFSSHTLPLPKGLMGACDMNGSVVFYYIPWIYQSWRKRELDAFREMLAKEPDRKKNLAQWANDWRETHVRLNKKLSGQAQMSNVKVDLHEEDDDELEKKKKKKDDDEDSIFKIGHFEPRKNVLPRDCKAYYRELYKWYLRRRGRTTRLMEEKERKWYEEEEKAIIKDLLKNKRIDLGQLQKAMVPLVQNENRLKAKEGRVVAMLAQADKIFKNAVSKIFNVVNFNVSYASKDSLVGGEDNFKLADALKEIDHYFGPNFRDAETELFSKINDSFFENRSFEDLVREKLKKRELFNDRRRFWDPEEKWMRIMARNMIEENGFICGQWEPHELTYEYRKYANRLKYIDEHTKLFGDEYDPFWDVDVEKPTTTEKWPYNWPYTTEEELTSDGLSYKSEHRFPLVNQESGLDLDFIANTDQDVVAMMLHEQQQGIVTTMASSSTFDLEDRLPHTRNVPLSNSQLSLFKKDVLEQETELEEETSKRKTDDESVGDDESHQEDESKKEMESKAASELKIDVTASELAVSQSSVDVGIKPRSKIEVKSSKIEDSMKMETSDSIKFETSGSTKMESAKTDRVSFRKDSLDGSELEGEERGEEEAEPQFGSAPPSARSAAPSEGAEASGSHVLLPGDPLYPENWREICEDECLSEGESIPSPRSSPSNVTDFSEITEVELFVPSDVEEEPYREYFDESPSHGPTLVVKPTHLSDEEPTEEYVGESDEETSDGTSRKRGVTSLKGKHVATSSSGSSDDDDEKRQDLERTFSQIIAERKTAMAEREQQLRELD